MELWQLRYFVRVVELGSMGRASLWLGVGTSAFTQQISRLETELSVRLLRRTPSGVVATDAGLAFWHQAQLAIRHADDAVRAARLARVSSHVRRCAGSRLPIATSSTFATPFSRGTQCSRRGAGTASCR